MLGEVAVALVSAEVEEVEAAEAAALAVAQEIQGLLCWCHSP